MFRKLYWKRKLRVPSLTDKANRRFDQILTGLSDRQEGAAPKPAGPAHYAKPRRHRFQEPDPQRGTFPVEEEPRRRWPSAVGGAALTLAALALASLPLLNWVAPALAEGLPWVGRVFQAMNHTEPFTGPAQGVSSAPSTAPQAPAACSLALDSAQVLGRVLLLDLELDFPAGTAPETDWLTTGWDGEEGLSAQAEGAPLPLYSAVTFTRQGEGFTGRAVFQLAEEYRNGASVELSVTVTLTRLFGPEGDPLDILPPRGDFSVAALAGWRLPEAEGRTLQNGVALELVSWEPEPGVLTVGLTAPTWPNGENFILEAFTDEGTYHGAPLVKEREDWRGVNRKIYELTEIPAGVQRVTLYLLTPDIPWLAGTGGRLAAEFTVELDTGTVYATESGEDLGWRRIDLALPLAVMEAGPCYGEDHLALAGMWVSDTDQEASDAQLLLISDADRALDKELVVVTDEGKRYSVPLSDLDSELARDSAVHSTVRRAYAATLTMDSPGERPVQILLRDEDGRERELTAGWDAEGLEGWLDAVFSRAGTHAAAEAEELSPAGEGLDTDQTPMPTATPEAEELPPADEELG